MIAIINLSISFEKKIILNNINLKIQAGETAVILGKNGSGKSVLLKAIAGLIDKYNGTIKINNININDYYKIYKSKKAQNTDKFSMAYVFQKGGLFDSMNVFDNVAFPLQRIGEKEHEIREAVLYSLKRLGLSGNEYKLPSELSGGMQKRVGIARAICSNPDIILYDDPTAGLDPILSDSITDIICDIKKTNRSTSVVVTHDITAAKKIADKIILLYNGNIVFSGSNYDFFNGDNIYADQFINGDLNGPIDIF